ncbi:hypothetical protein FACS189472_04540 [Alphaproteobacteria bacterium]|nr:hypothetical protein FACS189472_04540 [Alphaproteobacteria bacterium]
MADNSFVNKYVRSLHSVAVEAGIGMEVSSQLNEIKKVVLSFDNHKKFLKRITLLKSEGAKFINALKIDLGLSETVGNFLDVLESNNRLFMILDICNAYEAHLDTVSGKKRIYLTFANAASESEQEKIKRDLAEVFGKKVEYDVQFDPSLIDGFKIQYRSKILDYSALSKIRRLRNAIRRGSDEN